MSNLLVEASLGVPLLRARVKENSPLQNDANIVTYVEGWALRYAR